MEGFSIITRTADSASMDARTDSGSRRQVVPLRFTTASQPSSATQARAKASGSPARL